jgi:hypothetical protein
MKKTLLLDINYQPQIFLDFKSTFKKICKDKIEILESWEDDMINFYGSYINLPSVVKLTYSINRKFFAVSFSRGAVILRDKNKCQYCNKKLLPSEITIDHVLPRAMGGGNSFNNCVVSCFKCNNKKSHKTIEEAGMKLIKKPISPSATSESLLYTDGAWHPSWKTFLGQE